MRTLSLWILLAVLATPAQAQPARPLTPDEAVALGLAHSRTLDAAARQVVEASAYYREARTRRLPVLSGHGTYQRLSPNVPGFEISLPQRPGTTTLVPAIHNRYNLQLSIQQPLFTGHRIGAGIAAAEAQTAAARQEHARAEADLTLEIQEAYWTFYKAVAVREVLAAAVDQVEAHLERVRHLLAEGLATNSDVLAVEARLADVRLTQVEADNGAHLARLNLNHLTGLPLDTEVTPASDVDITPPAGDVEALVATALSRRPELAALAHQVDALEAGVRAARAGRYPQVALSGSYRYARPNPYFLPPEDRFEGTWDVGLALSMDLWSWGRTDAQVEQARARQRQAEDHLAELHERVRLDVHRRYLDVQRARETVAAARQSVAAAEEAYRITRQRYEQGLAVNADVLDAEVAQRDARTRYEQARADYALAHAALAHAVGLPD